MKKIRIILGILIIIPLGLVLDVIFFHPIIYETNSLQEYVFLLIGIPIFVLNLWAWTNPKIIETVFGLKTNEDE